MSEDAVINVNNETCVHTHTHTLVYTNARCILSDKR